MNDFDKYLEKERKRTSKMTHDEKIIDAHKQTDKAIKKWQKKYDKAISERLLYIKKHDYPETHCPEFDRLVSEKVDAEEQLERFKRAKTFLLPLPKNV